MEIWHDLLHINGEIAHWLFEAEGLLIGVAWHWLWQRRHDRLRHGVGPCSKCSEGHTSEGDYELRTPVTWDELLEGAEEAAQEMESISGVHPIQRGVPDPADLTYGPWKEYTQPVTVSVPHSDGCPDCGARYE